MEKILPQIKFKYYKLTPHGNDNFVCVQCGKKSTKVGSANMTVNPPEKRCEQCAIENFAYYEGFKSLKAATARRRRLFDVNYLFREMVTDRILEKESKTYDALTYEEESEIFNMATEIWNDNEFITKEEKVELEETFLQVEIEKKLNSMLDEIDFYRVG